MYLLVLMVEKKPFGEGERNFKKFFNVAYIAFEI